MARSGASKKAEKKSAAAPRTDWKTPADLREYAAKLSERAKKMLALAQTIEDSELGRVQVDGVQKFSRGTKAIDEFTLNVEHGIGRQRLR